jgi:hypothetical protein
MEILFGICVAIATISVSLLALTVAYKVYKDW